MNEHARTAAKKIFHVARLDEKDNTKFAFNIRRREDGGIGISSIRKPLADDERTSLFAHFGKPITARTGGVRDGKQWEGFADYEPGTEEHFLASVHALPDPFCLVASED